MNQSVKFSLLRRGRLKTRKSFLHLAVLFFDKGAAEGQNSLARRRGYGRVDASDCSMKLLHTFGVVQGNSSLLVIFSTTEP